MKKLFLFLIISSILFSCEKDSELMFHTSPEDVIITFEPIAGGAIMRYELPDDSNIEALKVEYKDYQNNNVLLKGTYTNDSIVLKGFIDNTEDVPVYISLLDSKGNCSKSVLKYFSVNKSSAYSVFDKLSVTPYWAGFKVEYEAEGGSDGFLHIANIGLNQFTNDLDTLILETLIIKDGKNVRYFSDVVNEDKRSTVVIWTENFRGRIVHKEVFEDIASLSTSIIDGKDFGFTGPSEENEAYKYGWKYLFDGDTNGTQKVENNNSFIEYTYVSTPYAVPGYIVLDIKEAKKLAKLKVYSMLNTKLENNWAVVPFGLDRRMPSQIKVYASNDENLNLNEWDELGEYYESKYLAKPNRWTARMTDSSEEYLGLSEIEKADPNYININFEPSDIEYRYIRIDILETYPENFDRRFSIHELEIHETVVNN